ncbi:hypothetical protein K466DRAFT_71787 [Polyporus arcularius HHB13444]|uniref:Uncharacterized protein n=1 Tax=Polyporus arcularius HHB13444 TaxID=1314778 RepID=A0A5C3PVU2_9APHY|nr:hypothetical protein K466DRAFT_71787 [Polyporus arcularius HHB13444]
MRSRTVGRRLWRISTLDAAETQRCPSVHGEQNTTTSVRTWRPQPRALRSGVHTIMENNLPSRTVRLTGPRRLWFCIPALVWSHLPIASVFERMRKT